MKVRNLMEAVFYFILTNVFLAELWQLLELHFYGEVQPRVVDNIMAFQYSLLCWFAYIMGLHHSRKGDTDES